MEHAFLIKGYIMKKVFVVIYSLCITLLSCGLTACANEKQYALAVNGSALLYENLNETYKAGEEVTIKVKIKPYEGIKASLDLEQLVKTKSAQDEYWQFTFEMPAHDAVLDITSYKGFDEPILYGFYLTFYDKDNEQIEEFNKPLDSNEAIADYAVITYDNNIKVYSSNAGANVFADSKTKFSNISYELEDTIYYTYELIDAVAVVDWVYLNEETQTYSCRNCAGYNLNNLGGSTSTSAKQNLSDTRYNSHMEGYEEKFDSYVKVNFKYLDYLTGVKILEFGSNGELIKSTEIAKSESEITHTVGVNYEYAVIEEEYTVKSGQNIGETHVERTLINKSEFGDGKLLKYPRGNGLILPIYLSIKWQNETF